MDVTDSTFESAVIERSRAVPVVVDFWAEWCGPCRQLGPVLERGVAAREGKVELAKIDVDANPQVARAFAIQSIPAVKAFRDGQMVAEFVGAQPPAAVESFLDSLVPSEADELVARGDEESLRRAVELEPSRAEAAVPLARLLHGRGDPDGALAILRRVPGSFAADGLAARIELESAEPTEDVRDAFAALDAGDEERALDLLIGALPSADGAKDDIRRVVVGILDELGVENPLAPGQRPVLSRRRPGLQRERELLLGRGPGGLQSGHADPQQPDRPWRREPPQQVQGHRQHPVQRGHGLGQGPGARVGGEVVEPHLDADRAPLALLAHERRAQLLGQPLHDLLQRRRVGDVVVKRGLA
jgi:putative thioredoxin